MTLDHTTATPPIIFDTALSLCLFDLVLVVIAWTERKAKESYWYIQASFPTGHFSVAIYLFLCLTGLGPDFR